jgi:hypothetical protein
VPRTTKHLKRYQWKPGQSGNPNGPIPGHRRTFEAIVASILDERTGIEVPTLNEDGTPGVVVVSVTKREAIAGRFVEALLAGDLGAMREFLARAWPADVNAELPEHLKSWVDLVRDYDARSLDGGEDVPPTLDLEAEAG